MHADADWLPVSEEEKEALDCIEAYIKRTEKDEMLTTMFLESICNICKIRKEKALSESPSSFCLRKGLAERIQELLENKPTEQMCIAMLAIAALSEVKADSKDKIIPLLNACCQSFFYLPPKENLNIGLYNHTLYAMDRMLQVWLVSSRTSDREELQNILEVLLPFTTSESKTVRERAIERIWKLCGFLASSFCPKPLKELLPPTQRTDIVLMTLEKTTGNCSIEDQEYARIILEMVLKDPFTWLTDVTEILDFIHTNLKKNEGSLQQTVLTLLDTLISHFPNDVTLSVLVDLPEGDSTTLKIWKDMLSSPVSSGRVLKELFFILNKENFCRILTKTGVLHKTVPEILGSIHRNLKENHSSLHKTLFGLVDMLTTHFPRDVLKSLLMDHPQCDRTTMKIWRSMLSSPESSDSVLEELLLLLENRDYHRIPRVAIRLLCQTMSEILGSIHRILRENRRSLQQIAVTLLDILTRQFLRDVLKSVLMDLPQYDSITLDMWKRILTQRETSAGNFDELLVVLGHQVLCDIPNITTVELKLLRLTVMPPTEENLKELCKPAVLQRLLKTKSLPILWLVLRGLDLLSQRPETGGQCSLDEKEIVCFGQAKEIWALVPNITFTALFDNVNIALKLLTVFRNTLNHLGKREASYFALELSENLLPLFSHVSSEVRECSIHLFKDLMEAVVLWHWGNMKENVRRGLLPLLFRLSDETPSVAQASREALVACAKFLKWKKLKHRAREENKEGIMKCLMQQGRKTAEGYLWQSLPYLRDSQSSVRCEAVKLIGLAVQHCRDQSEQKLNEIYSGE
ncbi:UNVERIFIED_CONTAM: hypothetical protein H355_006930 [Colinus virginianus]|nr:hypothetical protein H355_006930 [Colinus virginianus]